MAIPQTTFTQGPWKYTQGVVSNEYYIQTEAIHRNSFIGEVGGGHQNEKEKKANAKLIAAAPDLLYALELLLNVYRSDGTDDFYNIDPEEIAMNAITKATS